MQEYLTTKEFAARIGVATAYVRQLVIAGKVNSIKAGRDHLIPISEVEKARARRTKKGPEPKAKKSD